MILNTGARASFQILETGMASFAIRESRTSVSKVKSDAPTNLETPQSGA